MTEEGPATYVVSANTMNSSVGVGTDDPSEALRLAREMSGPDATVKITDRTGREFSIAELETAVREGNYLQPAKPQTL